MTHIQLKKVPYAWEFYVNAKLVRSYARKDSAALAVEAAKLALEGAGLYVQVSVDEGIVRKHTKWPWERK